MRQKTLRTGLAVFFVGFISGSATCMLMAKRPFSSEKVLKLVRKQAGRTLPVDGAWITLKPQTIKRDALTATVYKGGLTLAGDPPVRHLDFIADARTGALIELRTQ